MDDRSKKDTVKIKAKQKKKIKLKPASPKKESPKKMKLKVKKVKEKKVKEKKRIETNIELDIAEKAYNDKLKGTEKKEIDILEKQEKLNPELYPTLNDPNFLVKIAKKLEFSETKYKGDIGNVEIMADKMCNEERELAPHQIFVRNFLSFNTPYNSLLLYHGLGSGKTCAAVGIMEECRVNFKQLGINKKIFVLAQPNVQNNFKNELFDSRKLKQINGIWTLKSCIGEQLLKEINCNSIKMTKEVIVKAINKLIRNAYKFIGYEEFASYIIALSNIEGDYKKETKKVIIRKKLNSLLENTLIVIDEVHNIRAGAEKKPKRIYDTLMILANYVDNLRFLFLSATPMFNNSLEIIPLVNIMNANDNRSMINVKEVFDENGNLKINKDTGETIGEDLLKIKINGYVSYVRGENPYSYPYKIYPILFQPEKSIRQQSYPEKMMNGADIIQPIQYIDLFTLSASEYQEKVYNYIIEHLKTEKVSFETLESFGYTLLTPLVQTLNIVYPNNNFIADKNVRQELLYGLEGLRSVMDYSDSKRDYRYKKTTLDTYGRIFSKENIATYSPKIKKIIDSIETSKGIILIYSNYLEAGLVPIALALEEFGIKRHGDVPSLFKEGDVKNKSHFKYVIISGDKSFSPNNNVDLKACTNEGNYNGDDVKVVLISRAGTEGLDFRNIRQVHILEPWYNMNRINQTIGRAVRTKSHCQLPFLERNVMIFLYGTLFSNNIESTDLYIYRHAEEKAVQIGKINRLLKQNAVDCLLNKEQGNFTEEALDQSYEIILSNLNKINYKIGDKPFSEICDYMESCNFLCNKEKEIRESDVTASSYNQDFASFNNDKIIKKIKYLFKEYYFLKKEDLIANLNIRTSISLLQIYSALNKLLYDNNEFLYDRYGKPGKLLNIGTYYLFQPIEVLDTNISVFERVTPIDIKRKELVYDVPKQMEDNVDSEEPSGTISIKTNISKETKKGTNKNFDRYLEELKEKYALATTFSGKTKATSSWYEVLNSCLVFLEPLGMTKQEVDNYIIQHIVDTVPYSLKLTLLDYLYSSNSLDEIEGKMKAYLDKYIFGSRIKGIILLNNTNKSTKKIVQTLLVLNKGKWKEALPEQKEILSKDIIAIHKEINDSLAKIYGFMVPFKKNNEVVFKIKTKDTTQKGARCDQANKAETITLIKEIVKHNLSIDITIPEKISNNILCCAEEVILRHFNEKNDKNTWFVNPERAAFI